MSHIPIATEFRFLRIPTNWTRRKERMSGQYMLVPEVDQSPERKLEPILDDPGDLRTEFLKLPHTEKAALTLLKKMGVWAAVRDNQIAVRSDGTLVSRESSVGIRDMLLAGAFGYRDFMGYALPLTIEELWAEQEYWKELLLKPRALHARFATPPNETARPADKDAFARETAFGNTLPIHLEWKKGPRQFTHAVIQPIMGREFLIASAWVDVVREEKVQVCQRRDCGVPFTGRKQKYCSDNCGHLEAVRAARKRKSEPREAAGRKKREAEQGRTRKSLR
jgi:hypothetical protein